MTEVAKLTKHDTALNILAGGAWLIGRSIARNQSELALRARTSMERADAQARAVTYNFWSNVGAGVIGWQMFQKYPKATVGVTMVGLVAWGLVSWASLPHESIARPFSFLPPRKAAPPPPSDATAGLYGEMPYHTTRTPWFNSPNYYY